jgi:hypothetical protein
MNYKIGDEVEVTYLLDSDHGQISVGDVYEVISVRANGDLYAIVDKKQYLLGDSQVRLAERFDLEAQLKEYDVTVRDAEQGHLSLGGTPYTMKDKHRAHQAILGCLALLKHWGD